MNLQISGLKVDAGTGAGSRGGVVIGHTSSGKPIYKGKEGGAKHSPRRVERVSVKHQTVSPKDGKSWKMRRIEIGKGGISGSVQIHPEHHETIKSVKHGESKSFKDETGKDWHVHRQGDDLHFATHDIHFGEKQLATNRKAYIGTEHK